MSFFNLRAFAFVCGIAPIWFVSGSTAVQAEEPAAIELFSPQGAVATARQVRVRFSHDVAPLGDLQAIPDPMTANCLPQMSQFADGQPAVVPDGTGRWIDSSNWVYEFSSDLPSEIGCTFQVSKSFATSRPGVRGPMVFSFSTEPARAAATTDPCKSGGPEIVESWPGVTPQDTEVDEYTARPAPIEENQSFVVTTNCPVDPGSILRSVYLEVEGIKDRVGVQLVEGAAREKLLADRSLAGRENALVIRPRLHFPSGAKVELVWGKGTKSVSGIARATDRRLQYSVRPPFEALARCSHSFADGSCDPFLPIYAAFTNAFDAYGPSGEEWGAGVALEARDGRRWRGKKAFFSEQGNHFAAYQFSPPFPEKEELKIIVPQGLRDKSGRSLENRAALPVKVRTGKIPPMVRFSSVFGVVEQNAGAALPVTLRSVDPEVTLQASSHVDAKAGVGALNAAVTSISNPAEVLPWLVAVQNRYENIEKNTTSLFASGATATAVDTFTVTKPSGAEPFEVLGIPLPKPGFYVLEVASPSMGKDLQGPGTTMYVPTTALVTNLAVHAKLGKESSLAWVTALDSGAPVSGAEVSVRDCKGSELFHGRSDVHGLVRIPELPQGWEHRKCGLEQKWINAAGVASAAVRDGILIISAQKAEDFSFVLSNWDDGIEAWRYGLMQDYWEGRPQAGHAILDRTLFRRGETVHIKSVLRRKSTTGFDLLPSDARPPALLLRHVGDGEETALPLVWKENGTAENVWEIPAASKLGDYNIFFRQQDGTVDYRFLGSFSVRDYRVPLMRAVIVPPQEELITPGELPLDVTVRYLAGGGASGLPVKLRYQTTPTSYSFGGLYEGFSFADDVEEIAPVRCARNTDDEYPDVDTSAPAKLQTISGSLDATGSARFVLADLPRISTPSRLMAELEYKDPNGEIQTVSRQLPLLPSSYLVGIKTDAWANLQSGFQFSVATVTGAGKAVPQRPVVVRLLQREVYTHRKKLVGGTFAYENSIDESDKGVVCSGTTDSSGILRCAANVQLAGEFVLEARSSDTRGRETKTASVVFIGQDDYWFAQGNTDRMDILPEKRQYEPGETGRFQVRLPFKNATALVTVEREGILDAFVVPLSRSNPIIELPIKENYGPNVFVSVMAVRGRIAEAMPTAVFDPGKPAFRLGMTGIQVGWKGYDLKVAVSTERGVYKVREKVPVKIRVRTPEGVAPPAGTEVALAAVDEGLLELKPNNSWNLLEALMDQRGLSVQTLTAQMFVIGKRHFGLKALPFGGGGGKSTSRELFDTLLYWNPSVVVDADGEATVEVPLNDSITSFKIVGVAIGGVSRFGTGSTTIRSSKDFILFSGMPPVARNGDAFTFELTARNATSESATVEVSLRSAAQASSASSQQVTLAGGESKVLSWPMQVPDGVDELRYSAAVSRAGVEEDALVVSQKIVPAVPVRTQQSTLLQLDGKSSLPVRAPSAALPGRGGLRVSFSGSLADAGAGIREYMQRYPFGCLEQRASKAIALSDSTLWEKLTSDLSGYLDRDGFAKYFPSMDRGDETLTTYLLSIAHGAQMPLPPAVRQQMLDALSKFIEGKVRVPNYQNIARFYEDVGYKSKAIAAAELDLLTRRIAAVEALSRYGAIEPVRVAGLWPHTTTLPTEAVVNLLSIAARLPELPGRAARLKELEDVLRSRLDLQGTTLKFAGEAEESFFWSMLSGDVTAVRFVSTVLSDDELYAHFAKDAGRLVRGMLERQRKGHWDLTVANAWGRLALDRQRTRLEPVKPTGKSLARMPGAQPFEVAWDADGATSTLFAWPNESSMLELTHSGRGAPWVTVESQAAIPRSSAVAAGYAITKALEPVQQKVSGELHVGDVVRVRVAFAAQAARTWVVVDDPVPAGASILGSGLARDSALLPQSDASTWFGPSFEERGFDGYRAYFRELPRGDSAVQYLMRLNAAGTFVLPATRIEAMYSPEIFGEAPNSPFTVLP